MYRVVLRLFAIKRAFSGEIDFTLKMEWLVATLEEQLIKTTKTSKKPTAFYSVNRSREGMDILGNKRLAKGLVFWPNPWRL